MKWLMVVVAVVALGGTGMAAEVSSADLAGAVLAKGGVSRGVCCVLGGGELAVEIAAQSGLLVHALDPCEADVSAARSAAAAQGLTIDRIVIEKGVFGSLPYAANLVDLVVAVDLDEAALGMLSPDEILRVLRPKGKAVLGGSASAKGIYRIIIRCRRIA